METHETQKNYCGLMKLIRLRDSYRLMRLRETAGD